MKIHRVEHLVKSLFLSIFLTHSIAHGASETRLLSQDAYERRERQFVLSPKGAVSAFCDNGDTLVAGECEVVSDFEDLFNPFEANPISVSGRSGWTCRPKIFRVREELRVTTFVKCKKTTPETESSADTKTPRNRGA